MYTCCVHSFAFNPPFTTASIDCGNSSDNGTDQTNDNPHLPGTLYVCHVLQRFTSDCCVIAHLGFLLLYLFYFQQS